MSEALIGWENISKYLGISKYTAKRRRRKLLEAGIMFYISVGRPPKRKIATFPNLLQAYILKRGEF